MKGVMILASLVGLGFATWIGYILVNGVRERIATVNRRRRERNRRNGY